MIITPETEDWLKGAGYRYHCFISWAHTKNQDMTDFAQRLKVDIEQLLALSIPDPHVFLDRSDLQVADDWSPVLQEALCRSVAMVAVCAPIYFHPVHKWCGLEWAAMDMLGQQRLGPCNLKSIIPVFVRKTDPMPEAASAIQGIDLSKVTVLGRRYYARREYREQVHYIVERIGDIVQALAGQGCRADCESLAFPTGTPFADYGGSRKPFPFRS